MKPILETERLVFVPFTAEDLPLVVELHSDPEVQRYFGGAWSAEEMQASLDRFVSSQAQLGMSKWKAYLRDGTFVGRAGIGPHPPGRAEQPERELGYAFKPAFWGMGLATEAARGIAAWFFATTDHDRLMGFTHPDNHASQAVLKKIGMRFMGFEELGFAEPSAVYRMDRPA